MRSGSMCFLYDCRHGCIGANHNNGLGVIGQNSVQSCVHLASLSVLAVNIRFVAFAVQVVIVVYWICKLL